MEKKLYKNFLQENGYCLIKNFFNIDEVEKLRKFVLKNYNNNQDIYLSNNDDALDTNLLSEKYFTWNHALIYSSWLSDYIQLPTNTPY